jgi:hypothetical protein
MPSRDSEHTVVVSHGGAGRYLGNDNGGLDAAFIMERRAALLDGGAFSAGVGDPGCEAESVYFCQPGIHRSLHFLAGTLDEVLKIGPPSNYVKS